MHSSLQALKKTPPCMMVGTRKQRQMFIQVSILMVWWVKWCGLVLSS